MAGDRRWEVGKGQGVYSTGSFLLVHSLQYPLRKDQHFSAQDGKRRVVFAKLLLVAWLLSCNRGVLAFTFTLHRHDNHVQNYDVVPSRRFLWVLLSNYFLADYLFKNGSSTLSHQPPSTPTCSCGIWPWHSSHQDVGFCPPPLTPCLRSGWAWDCFYQQNMAERMRCDFWNRVSKGHATDLLWMLTLQTPLGSYQSLSTRLREAQAMHGGPIHGPSWAFHLSQLGNRQVSGGPVWGVDLPIPAIPASRSPNLPKLRPQTLQSGEQSPLSLSSSDPWNLWA